METILKTNKKLNEVAKVDEAKFVSSGNSSEIAKAIIIENFPDADPDHLEKYNAKIAENEIYDYLTDNDYKVSSAAIDLIISDLVNLGVSIMEAKEMTVTKDGIRSRFDGDDKMHILNASDGQSGVVTDGKNWNYHVKDDNQFIISPVDEAVKKIKRRHTEEHPAVHINPEAKMRNKIVEFIGGHEMCRCTERDLKEFLSSLAEDEEIGKTPNKSYITSNKRLFKKVNVGKTPHIKLTGIGKRVYNHLKEAAKDSNENDRKERNNILNPLNESRMNEAAQRQDIKKYNDMEYEIWHEVPKGYYAIGKGEMKDQIAKTYFDKQDEAEEHAKLEIDGYLGESLDEAKLSLDDYKEKVISASGNKNILDDQINYEKMVDNFTKGIPPEEFVKTISEATKKEIVKKAKEYTEKNLEQWDEIEYEGKKYYFDKVTNNAVILSHKPNKLSPGISVDHADFLKYMGVNEAKKYDIEDDDLRMKIADQIKYHERGLPPTGSKYSIRRGGKVFTSNDTGDLVDDVINALNKGKIKESTNRKLLMEYAEVIYEEMEKIRRIRGTLEGKSSVDLP